MQVAEEGCRKKLRVADNAQLRILCSTAGDLNLRTSSTGYDRLRCLVLRYQVTVHLAASQTSFVDWQ